MLEQDINQISPPPHKSLNPPPSQPPSSTFPLKPNTPSLPFPLIYHTTSTTTTTTDMSHHTTDRRMLATSSHPKTSMDSTHKKHHPESSLNTKHRVRTTTRDQTHVGLDTRLQAKAMSVSAMADPDVQTQLKKATKSSSKEKSSSRRPSKSKDSRGANNGQEIVMLQQYPTKEEREKKEVKEEREEIKRLSSGAIVKIKELKVSDELEHDLKRPSTAIGRRRSLCGSHVELADFFSSTCARIVSVDMPPFMQIHAVGCARKACDSLEKFTSKALALTLKKEFDGVYGPAWHCIVGSSFGSFVTHSVGGFLYFSMDQKLYVLLFKTSVQKAD